MAKLQTFCHCPNTYGPNCSCSTASQSCRLTVLCNPLSITVSDSQSSSKHHRNIVIIFVYLLPVISACLLHSVSQLVLISQSWLKSGGRGAARSERDGGPQLWKHDTGFVFWWLFFFFSPLIKNHYFTHVNQSLCHFNFSREIFSFVFLPSSPSREVTQLRYLSRSLGLKCVKICIYVTVAACPFLKIMDVSEYKKHVMFSYFWSTA